MAQLGKYDILEEFGRGGFGIVYNVIDTALDVNRALKVLHPSLFVDPQALERFKREAKFAARLDHNNIVPVYDIGEESGQIYLVMKYMAGGSLKDKLSTSGPISLDETLEILRQVSDGLNFAHENNIIHRDLKPGNILFDEAGNVRISDFGFAKVLSDVSSAGLTMSGALLGTPSYMPPELWNGMPAPSPATDVYSLACIFFEMITGEVLFNGDTPSSVMLKHFSSIDLNTFWPSGISEAYMAILEQALAKEPSERYQSSKSFHDALQKPTNAREKAKEKETAQDDTAKEIKSDKGFEIPIYGVTQLEINNKKVKVIRQEKNIQLKLPGDLFWEFCYIPAGEFLMGASEDIKDAFRDEKPQHLVHLDEYWIAEIPVTNTIYKLYKPNYKFTHAKWNHPVVNVTWYDAHDFCEWLSRLANQTISLPTEAQWEKAARGTDGRKYPWGNQLPNMQISNFGKMIGDTTPCNHYSSGNSPYGVVDMSGNVWEWVKDWYDKDYYKTTPYKNPTGPESGTQRILRGGSWKNSIGNIRVSVRVRSHPDITYKIFGFRCVCLP